MKRGKEERRDGGNSEPLFPRLNITDREIGGPKAPPRNKMALYEQLSISSQRFKSTTSQVYGKNMSTSSEEPNIQPSGQLSKRTHSQSLDNSNLNTKMIQSGTSFRRQSKDISVTANGSSSNSHRQLISSDANRSYQRSLVDESDNDFTVPTFFQSTVSSSAGKNSYSSTLNHEENLLNELPLESSNEDENGARCFIDFDVLDKGDEYLARNESCAEGDTFNQQSENRASELHENEDMVINDMSGERQSGSTSAMMICPDDVVGVIGPKHFWKARRAIVNQQKLFAIQVFELHRLIKVQKLIAASPDIVKVDKNVTPSPYIRLPEASNKIREPTIMQKVPFQNLEASSDHSIDNGNVQDAPTNMMTSSQWCFHPNLNQWLMPVMSPTEGLIYKPYPSGTCMPPFYSNPNQMSFHMLPYNVPYQQPPPMYYTSPYALPFTNQNEQNSVHKPLFLEKQTSTLSCNLSNPISEVILSQVQGSCVNQILNDVENENRNVVVRVVPRKAVLATESAAGIFRCIQEERKQYDS